MSSRFQNSRGYSDGVQPPTAPLHPLPRIRGKNAVEFPFKSGFNILYGSSDTGKTFLVEAIDFMLGAGDDLRDIPERNGFDSILLGLSAHGKDYTIQRSVNKGAFQSL